MGIVLKDMPLVKQREHQVRRSGFTVIELLVIISIVAILISILVPTLGSARKNVKSLLCMVHIRDIGSTMTAYTTDNASVFPAWLDDREYANNRKKWQQYTFQPLSTLAKEKWRDYAGLTSHSEIFYCPANQLYPEEYETNASPDYVMSASIYAEVSYMNPDNPESYWRRHLGNKVQTIDAVRFPSVKVGLLEQFVWHGWDGVYTLNETTAELEYNVSVRPGSLWFMDGHTEQIFAAEAFPYVYRYPIWPYMPFGTTAMGIEGRDR